MPPPIENDNNLQKLLNSHQITLKLMPFALYLTFQIDLHINRNFDSTSLKGENELFRWIDSFSLWVCLSRQNISKKNHKMTHKGSIVTTIEFQEIMKRMSEIFHDQAAQNLF